jgi:hypothetical protein
MQRRGEVAISRISRKNTIYLLGGARFGDRITGPTGKGEPWTDCSGAAFFIAMVMGLPVRHIFDGNPIWTGSFVDLLPKGESDFLTFFLKEPHVVDGHVIMRLRERPKPWHRGIPRYRFAECGGSDNPHPAGGLHWLRNPGKGMGLSMHERLAEFDFHRCVKGF